MITETNDPDVQAMEDFAKTIEKPWPLPRDACGMSYYGPRHEAVEALLPRIAFGQEYIGGPWDKSK